MMEKSCFDGRGGDVYGGSNGEKVVAGEDVLNREMLIETMGKVSPFR